MQNRAHERTISHLTLCYALPMLPQPLPLPGMVQVAETRKMQRWLDTHVTINQTGIS